MTSLVKKAPAPRQEVPPQAPAKAPVVAQCCAKISRTVAGCHD